MRTGSGRADVLSRTAQFARRALVVVGFASVSAACSGSEPDEPNAGEGTPVGCEGRGESIELGMAKSSDDGLIEVTLTEAAPLPPVQGQNSWTVDVTQAGEPVLDADAMDSQVIANVYMAEHDHNIRKRGVMTAPGVFEFAEFPITMNGYWQVTVQVQTDPEEVGDQPEPVGDALFDFCVAN